MSPTLDFMTDGPLATPERTVSDYPIGTGRYVAESAIHAVEDSPLSELGRMAERYAAGTTPGATDIPIEEARQRVKDAGLDDVMKLTGERIKEPVLNVMIRQNQERRDREQTLARGPDGFVPNALAVGSSFLASAIDPINIGASMIPVVGEARMGRLLASAGESAMARGMVRAGVGGAQGAVGMGPLEGLSWYDATQEGRDYTLGEALRGVMFGAFLGGGLHAGFGALGDRLGRSTDHPAAALADLPPQAHEDALRMTLARLNGGQPVDTAEALRAAAARDPRLAESLGTEPGRPTGESLDAVWDHFASVPPPHDAPEALEASQAAEELAEPGSVQSASAATAGSPRAPASAGTATTGETAPRLPPAVEKLRQSYGRLRGDAQPGADEAMPTAELFDAAEGEHGMSAHEAEKALQWAVNGGHAVRFSSPSGRNDFVYFVPPEGLPQHAATTPRGTISPESTPRIQSMREAYDEVRRRNGGGNREIDLNDINEFMGFDHGDPRDVKALQEAVAAGEITRRTHPELDQNGRLKSTIEFPPEPIEQQRAAIADRVREAFVAAGRPEEEARAIAAVAAARYIARASRLEGHAGTAREMFERAGIEVRRGEEGTAADGRTFEQRPGLAPTFYSAVERAITSAKQAKASPDQWLGMLRNMPGVKPEELEWLGLENWLREQKGSVTKEQIVDYVRANQIEVREVTKPDQSVQERLAEIDRELPELQRRRDQEQSTEAARRISELFEESRELEKSGHPKYATYQLPGGENYRELLLTLPRTTPRPAFELINDQLIQKYGSLETAFQHWTREEEEEFDRVHLQESQSPTAAPPDFRSSHFDEPNIVAHVRFDDRTVNGKRTLFVQEIQSDWHQQGRKGGYNPPKLVERIAAARRDFDAMKTEVRAMLRRNDQLGFDRMNDAIVAVLRESPDKWEFNAPEDLALAQKYHDVGKLLSQAETRVAQGVPDAPFKTTWPELSLKRMLRYAAENGYDSIAWPGSADAVARVENWGAIRQEGGKWLVHGDHDVTPIVERYLTDLPRIAGKLTKKFGAKVERGEVDTGVSDNYAVRRVIDHDGIGEFQVYDAETGEPQEHFGNRAAAEDWIKEQVAESPRGQASVNTLDMTDKLREVATEQGFPLFQKGREGTPQGRVTFADNARLIDMFKSADASTGLHEMGHVWFEELIQDASRPDAPAALKSDLDAVMKWLGVDSPDAIETAHHEQFARGFEQYLREGKAPSEGLDAVFAKLREWLVTIYRQIRQLGTPISPEMRGVFDRMLATEDEIAANVPARHVGKAQRQKELSLSEFLAARGGISADEPLVGDVRSMFDGNPFIPGFGRLIRKGGRPLDELREAAHEAGYEIEGGRESKISDLLNALDAETRGQKRYRMGHEPEVDIDADENQHRIDQHIDAAFEDAGLPSPTGDLRARMLAMPEVMHDPMAAYERAIMEEHYAGTDEGAEHAGLPPDLPRTALSDDFRGAPDRGEGFAGERGEGTGPGESRQAALAGGPSRQSGDAGRPGGRQGPGNPRPIELSRATQAALADERRVAASFEAQRSFLSEAEQARLDDALREADLDAEEHDAIIRDGTACLINGLGA